MNSKQSINKSHTLLEKIANRGVSTEANLLSDKGLLELFSWGSNRAPRARLKDTLALLVRQGDLSLGSIDQEKLYKITSSGEDKLHLTKLRRACQKRPSSWNQRWHFVTYQIPESKKTSRNQLIIELKSIGFKRYSPALWIYPYDITPELTKLATYLKVAQYIDYLRADTISHASSWRRSYNI